MGVNVWVLGAHSVMDRQIVAGVLLKYVNLGKGWRHRLFILKGGVLRYYKVWSQDVSSECG
jgi:hypothetical protein